MPSSVRSSTTRSRTSEKPIKKSSSKNSTRHLKKPTNLLTNSIKKSPRSQVCLSTKISSQSKKSSKSCLILRNFSRDASKLPICSLRINKIEVEKEFFLWQSDDNNLTHNKHSIISLSPSNKKNCLFHFQVS